MFGDKDRRISNASSSFNVSLSSPIRVAGPINVKTFEDFGIHKDSKFSIRTLMILSVATIAVFGFGLKPASLFFESDSIRIFACFTWLVILGQGIITWLSYKLNLDNINGFIKKCEKAANELNYEKIEKEKYLDRINTGEEFEEYDSPPSSEEIEKVRKETMETIILLDVNLKRSNSVVKNSKVLYRTINGKLVFIIAGMALVAAGFAIVYDRPVIYRQAELQKAEPVQVNLNADIKCSGSAYASIKQKTDK
jgi:hypothetical protein